MTVERRRPTHGTVILIGGSEDKEGARLILTEVVRRAGGGPLVVATLASEVPDAQWERYHRVFRDLGVTALRHLAVQDREELVDADPSAILDDAAAVFFTGGDQVKIATKLGGTPLFDKLRDRFKRGMLIAGTSAGASAMGEAMLVARGLEEPTHKVDGAFYMTRGLGLVAELIIDQHFAQRARIERLIGAIAENPGVLGIGIDEDTGVVLEPDRRFTVMGRGAVYVADGYGITHTNVSEKSRGQTLSLFDVRLHVLNHGTGFDLGSRRPFKATHE
ncbi:MAG TPA: cyanophycinase [Vicinamibacterales bacterium]|nr:cyanophycinase [Vicinamibacterales bacterium]